MTLSEATLAAIAGLGCGDCFGAPFEYQKNAPEMAQLSLDEQRYLCSKEDVHQPRPQFWRMPGVYTDDTQQALLLMWLWMLSDNPTDGKQIRREFMHFCQSMADENIPGASYGLHRGTGGNFRQAVDKGTPVKTAGLGGPMRIGPVATMIEDPALVIPWTTQVTLATTNDPISLAGTVFFALICWREAHPGVVVDPSEWGVIPKHLVETWGHYREAISILLHDGEEALIEYAMNHGSDKKLNCAAAGFALSGVPWAVYHGFASANYSEAILNVCSSGGDTDTVAAMAGCLAAIRHGKDSIPTWMTEQLQGWSHIDDPDSWEPYHSETPLTKADAEFRAGLYAKMRKKVKK